MVRFICTEISSCRFMEGSVSTGDFDGLSGNVIGGKMNDRMQIGSKSCRSCLRISTFFLHTFQKNLI